MSCFGVKVSPDIYHNCCNANTLCEFDGNLENVVTEPIYVQKVYDAILFHLQGMKTVEHQEFYPCIPEGHRIRRVIDIRCRKFFDPSDIDSPANLKLDLSTSVSGASFLQSGDGRELSVVGADGTFSEKILYANTAECDDKCMGTPVFGTQNIKITGDVSVEMDLLLCDRCNNESVFTVSAQVNIADSANPLILTNFFEICMPETSDTAFLPRFTEFCSSACETRLATNNMGRDLAVSQDGRVCGNLIIAICISCEKKIVVPVQMCVLSTGSVSLTPQSNAVCTTFPALFPKQVKESDTIENCDDICEEDFEDSCNSCIRNSR